MHMTEEGRAFEAYDGTGVYCSHTSGRTVQLVVPLVQPFFA